MIEHNNDVHSGTEKVIMWAQWCFYLNDFFSIAGREQVILL